MFVGGGVGGGEEILRRVGLTLKNCDERIQSEKWWREETRGDCCGDGERVVVDRMRG